MSRPRTAVILAAGMGTRLGAAHPKTLTPIHRRTIIHRSLDGLAAAGVTKVVVVLGYRADEVVAAVGVQHRGMSVSYIVSDQYAVTNNAYSLWLAREHLVEDLYLLEGDVVFDAALLPQLAAADGGAVCAVAPWRPGLHGTVVEMDDGAVRRFHLGHQRSATTAAGPLLKTVNIALLRQSFLQEHFVPALDDLVKTDAATAFYEAALAELVQQRPGLVHAVDCGDLAWYEVDDLTDLEAAHYRFGSDADRLKLLCGLYGGHWRHDVVDHRLLYNLYFPPAELLDELIADFRESVLHYPVGQGKLQELLGAVVRQPAERLVVANGASELIKILSHVYGRVALVVPGFNEYEAVFDEGAIHRIHLPAPQFRLDVDDCVTQATAAGVEAVVLTSPNNPTSVAVPRDDLVLLCKELAQRGIDAVVDESFVDFCDEGQSLEPDVADLPNLVIVKSMSKVYGLGGLRLGYLLSADLHLVARIRSQLPIWNINGIAETFLRVLPRYRRAFARSCELVRRDRDEFYHLLRRINGVTVLQPDANYVLVRLPEPVSASATVRDLFAGHAIFTKDCGGKSMPDGDRHLRVAVRGPAENRRFAEALAELLACVDGGHEDA